MQYVGLRAIAARMGWKQPRSVQYHIERNDFPAYRRRYAKNAWNWISNDDLIYGWEVKQCHKSAMELRAGITRYSIYGRERPPAAA